MKTFLHRPYMVTLTDFLQQEDQEPEDEVPYQWTHGLRDAANRVI